MNIRYHLTVLPPKIPQAEALSQEIAALQNHFGGDLNYLNPNRHLPLTLIPRLLFGWHQLARLRTQESSLALHHVYNPDPFPFPVLLRLKRPVIYAVSSGVGPTAPNRNYFNRLAAIAVVDKRSEKRLRSWGLNNVVRVPPAIDTSRFSYTPTPKTDKFHVLVGSAPWSRQQFVTKGIDALLAAAQQDPQLHLTLLWRGVLADEIERRIAALGLSDRVTLVNQLVDVNAVLATVDATANLAAHEGIVKSYPHSLLDSLAAGKPVITSAAIPMADFVGETGCGVVIHSLNATAVLAGVAQLRNQYSQFQQNAYHVGQTHFSIKAMVDAYRELYERIASR